MAVLIALGTGSCSQDTPLGIQPKDSKVPQDVVQSRAVRERDRNIVQGSFIVLLKKRAGPATPIIRRLAARHGGKIGARWEDGGLRGFSIHNISRETYLAIAREPEVLVIEPERRSRLLGVQSLPAASAPYDTLWYLDRIDHYGSASYDSSYDYGSSNNTGSGVHIYIVDSGVRGSHPEFAGRLGAGFCHVSHYLGWFLYYVDTGCSPTTDPIGEGHGTGMAGLAAGSTLGVAKQATIHSVRVNDNEGGSYCSDIAGGLVWVREHAIIPAVVNLAIDVDCRSVRGAVQDLITAGVHVVKGGANLDIDAGDRLINRIPGLIVVGATTRIDSRWDPSGSEGSAWGSYVNISAPGHVMYVASGASNGLTSTTYSGTSNSSALVAGAIARVLQLKPSLTLAQLQTALYTQASPVTIAGGNGTANRVLYSGVSVSPDTYVPSLPSTASLSVQIEGYDEVRPGDGCYFHAYATGGSGTYSYVWRVGADEVGDDSEYLFYQNTVSSGSSFTVSVTIFDGTSSEETAFTVAVSSSAGECYVY